MYSDCSTLERWLASAAERTALPPSIASREGFGYAVLVVFLLTQAIDGVLTCIGVGMHGFHAEANPVAASLMAAFGLGPAVAGLKLVTGSLGVLLHALGVHRVLALIAGIYAVAALLPWAALLLAW
jgi:hypothetical protein